MTHRKASKNFSPFFSSGIETSDDASDRKNERDLFIVNDDLEN